jgi:argininosuccinate synthase
MMVVWIQEEYGMDVITCNLDVGQDKETVGIEKKAWDLGVINHYGFDAKEEFAMEYLFPAIKANALYMGTYPVSSSLSRPLIAKKLVEVAEMEDAQAVAHGCTGKWKFDRAAQIEWSLEHNIPVPVTAESPYSVDENLWGRSVEGGILEHPDLPVPDDIWDWTADIKDTPDEPELVKIGFHKGVPVSLDGVDYKPHELILKIRDMSGKHGIGRIEHMEDRIVGLKTRETYEVPAAETIINAHLDLEKMVLTRHQKLLKYEIDHKWATAVYQGLWVDPYKDDLDAYIDSTQKNLTGTVTMKLHKGTAKPIARESPMSLYDYNLASFDINTHYDQGDAAGFINLWGSVEPQEEDR